MKKHEKFLEFNGKNIVFLKHDGVYWVAIKPICEALGVNFDRQYKNLLDHKVFGQLYAKQPMTGADNKLYKMVSLPERYVYGWIFQINSSSDQLAAYQKTCCDILYDHFHGVITNRKELLMQKIEVDTQLHELKKSLLDQDETYQKIKRLEKTKKVITAQLTSSDHDLIRQPELFKD